MTMRQNAKSLALCACLALVSAASSAERQARSAEGQAPSAKVVEVSAERFAFTPSEIRAKVGQPLEIKLTSGDTDHGFKLLGTKIDVRIPKRGKGATTVTFDPPAAGRYTFECSHVCGAGHAFMRGVIVVTK